MAFISDRDRANSNAKMLGSKDTNIADVGLWESTAASFQRTVDQDLSISHFLSRTGEVHKFFELQGLMLSGELTEHEIAASSYSDPTSLFPFKKINYDNLSKIAKRKGLTDETMQGLKEAVKPDILLREAKYKAMQKRSGYTGMNAASEFASGIGASLLDIPVLLGGGALNVPIKGVSTAAKITKSAIENTIADAAMQPAVMSWKEQLGIKYTFQDAVVNTLSSGVAGGGFTGVGIFGKAAIKRLNGRIDKTISQEPDELAYTEQERAELTQELEPESTVKVEQVSDDMQPVSDTEQAAILEREMLDEPATPIGDDVPQVKGVKTEPDAPKGDVVVEGVKVTSSGKGKAKRQLRKAARKSIRDQDKVTVEGVSVMRSKPGSEQAKLQAKAERGMQTDIDKLGLEVKKAETELSKRQGRLENRTNRPKKMPPGLSKKDKKAFELEQTQKRDELELSIAKAGGEIDKSTKALKDKEFEYNELVTTRKVEQEFIAARRKERAQDKALKEVGTNKSEALIEARKVVTQMNAEVSTAPIKAKSGTVADVLDDLSDDELDDLFDSMDNEFDAPDVMDTIESMAIVNKVDESAHKINNEQITDIVEPMLEGIERPKSKSVIQTDAKTLELQAEIDRMIADIKYKGKIETVDTMTGEVISQVEFNKRYKDRAAKLKNAKNCMKG